MRFTVVLPVLWLSVRQSVRWVGFVPVEAPWIRALGSDWESTGSAGPGLADGYAPRGANLPLMTQTEVLLAAVIVAGFALLALTVAAFAFSRELAGVVVLV